ncbi:MAG TPA: hypothetical protein VIM41_03790 [Gammaproteobacteria bacterium]
MNISSIPTDSLYKFMAISGTIIFISGFYAIVYFLIKANQFAYEKDKEMNNHIAQGEYLAWLAKSTDGIECLSEEAKKLREHSFMSIYKIELISKYMSRIRAHFKLISVASIFVSVFGFALSVSGFWLWYTNSQLYLDMELQLKVMVLEKEANKAN